MNILTELNSLLAHTYIPVETGVFSGIAPYKYIVIVPLSDNYALHSDDFPGYDVQEARISLYSKSNYLQDKNHIIRTLFGADFTITGRQYIGYEAETGYHHYVVDVSKHYEMED